MYHCLNRAIPSRKFSIKTLSKWKNSVYVLTLDGEVYMSAPMHEKTIQICCWFDQLLQITTFGSEKEKSFFCTEIKRGKVDLPSCFMNGTILLEKKSKRLFLSD